MGELFVVIRRDFELERLHQIDGAGVDIGRSRTCGLWLPNTAVSRVHARILNVKGQLVIRDEKSRNGTFFNGEIISKDVELGDETAVTIGPYTLIFCHSIAMALKHTITITDETTKSQKMLTSLEEIRERMRGILTAAQCRVYECFLEGCTEREVSDRLKISVHTVHDHAKAIYKKLSVSTRSQLLALRKHSKDAE